MFTNHIYLIYMYKKDLALTYNGWYVIKPNRTKPDFLLKKSIIKICHYVKVSFYRVFVYTGLLLNCFYIYLLLKLLLFAYVYVLVCV